MLRFIFPLTLFAALLLAGHLGKGQSSSKDFKKKSSSLILMAWNEDTVHNYQFSLLKNGKFAYTIIDRNDFQNAKSYYGKCSRYFSDTLFLKYNKNICPPRLVKYLVGEGDGHYLIQKFTDTPKLVFLRLQHIGYRF